MIYVNTSFFDVANWMINNCKWIRKNEGVFSIYFRYPEKNLITDKINKIDKDNKNNSKYIQQDGNYTVVNRITEYYEFKKTNVILKQLLLDIVNETKTKSKSDLFYLLNHNNILMGLNVDGAFSGLKTKVDGDICDFEIKLDRQSLIDYLSDEHTAGDNIFISHGRIDNRIEIFLMRDDTDHYFMSFYNI